MTRRLRHCDAFAQLALLAALLLAVVPTLGRLLAPTPAPSAAPMMHVQAMAHGMDGAMARTMGHAAHANPGHSHAPGGGHRHEHDADCAYCPLLATTLVAPMQALAIASVPLPPAAPPRLARTRVPTRFHGSLGSRGPPIG
jgi:hypothetical protein